MRRLTTEFMTCPSHPGECSRAAGSVKKQGRVAFASKANANAILPRKYPPDRPNAAGGRQSGRR